MPPDAIHGHWSRAFRGPNDVQEIGKMAYDMFLSDNGIFSLRTEYMRRVEEEVIDMCVEPLQCPRRCLGHLHQRWIRKQLFGAPCDARMGA